MFCFASGSGEGSLLICSFVAVVRYLFMCLSTIPPLSIVHLCVSRSCFFFCIFLLSYALI